MEAIRPTQEIWEEHSVVVLAVTAILLPRDPLATTELGLEKLFVKRNYRKMTQ